MEQQELNFLMHMIYIWMLHLQFATLRFVSRKKAGHLQSVGMKTEVWQLKKGQLEHFLHFR